MKRIRFFIFLAWMILPSAIGAEQEDRGVTAGPLGTDAMNLPIRVSGMQMALTVRGYIDLVSPDLGLTEAAQAAITLSPDWVKNALAENLSFLDASSQDIAADLIMNPGDVNWRDEISFLMAHITPGVLMGNSFSPGLIRENVRCIYQLAPLLGYVELVEYGDPDTGGDYYTTTRYNYRVGGSEEWHEIPRDIYYWYVVHPKISDEALRYCDPEGGGGADPPTGVFWRNYLFFDSDVTASYQEHYLEYSVQSISDEELDDWLPSTRGTIQPLDVAPTDIAVDDLTGEPVLADIKYSSSSTVLATTLRVEAAYDSGLSLMLENLTDYGNGHCSLGAAKQIAVFMDAADPAGTVVLQVLDSQGRPHTEFTSADIGVVDLSIYEKVIIPSYQPRSLYQAVADNRQWFEDWLGERKIFEIHLATHDADDPVGLVFPGGFTTASQTDGTSDAISFYGYPLLADIVDRADVYWDEYSGVLPSGRFFETGSAVDILGNWVSKMVKYKARGDRPIQPVAIARGHDGNCGELQDLLTAGARTLLLPAQCANNHAWDHVWSEFWAEGTWHPYQVDWDGGVTRIDTPANGQDKDYGGGKDLSAVFDWRNDEYRDTITHRYSNTCMLDVAVQDIAGEPIDGAKVDIWVYRNNNPDYGLTVACAKYTDIDGHVQFSLGDNRDYWASVDSDLGAYPQSGDPEPVITGSVAGETYGWNVIIDGTGPVLEVTEAPDPPDPLNAFRVRVDYDVVERFIHPRETSRQPVFSYCLSGGDVDFFIADQANHSLYSSGQRFQAYRIGLDSHSGNVTLALPYSDTWYICLDAIDVHFAGQVLDCTINLDRDSGSGWTEIDSAGDLVHVPPGTCVKAKIVLEPNSMITDPADGQTVAPGYCTIRGTASGFMGNALDRIEVSIDGGVSWMEAAGLETWNYEWLALETGDYHLMSRAVDVAGFVENPDSGITVTVDFPCEITGVALWMPSHMFRAGDVCACKAAVCNSGPDPLAGYPLFVILDVFGSYFFAPSFNTEFDWYLNDYPSFPTGSTVVNVLPAFTWPEAGTAAGLMWYAALTDPNITGLHGEMDAWEFGWE
ncbi:hypothetical protein JXA40_09530 [bacterium]|nr:hypothetical protein [candidate division CSSED10-310 bacterium]